MTYPRGMLDQRKLRYKDFENDDDVSSQLTSSSTIRSKSKSASNHQVHQQSVDSKSGLDRPPPPLKRFKYETIRTRGNDGDDIGRKECSRGSGSGDAVLEENKSDGNNLLREGFNQDFNDKIPEDVDHQESLDSFAKSTNFTYKK